MIAPSVFLAAMATLAEPAEAPAERLRVMVETDAGGDPDDEQSMVRFLLYANEWDVEGIIAVRPHARPGENRNPERTGLGIVRRMLTAYRECYTRLKQHDRRYLLPEDLWRRTVAGYDDTDDGVRLILDAVDRDDPRPIWFCNWGTDKGSAESNLKRALDRVLKERGQLGYARFKDRLRLSSFDTFGPHTNQLAPPWRLWVDTFRPEIGGRRWYHCFSALTATAGGFDVRRDVLTGHGPLGALYPTNTTHPQKEGDTMAFLYLVPTGMNDPQQPTWGSWAGRYARQDPAGGRNYYWATAEDSIGGAASRENCLSRWAEHLQNDFRARLDWCVKDFAAANHPPQPRLRGPVQRTARSGQHVELDARGSTDPDNDRLDYRWIEYRECGTYAGPPIALRGASDPVASFVAPAVDLPQTVHVLLIVTDRGSPPLARYRRAIVELLPR